MATTPFTGICGWCKFASSDPAEFGAHMDAERAAHADAYAAPAPKPAPTHPVLVGHDRVGDVARDPEGWAFYLTRCCGASAKGSGESPTGACCRKCYRPVKAALGGLPPARFWAPALAAKLGVPA